MEHRVWMHRLRYLQLLGSEVVWCVALGQVGFSSCSTQAQQSLLACLRAPDQKLWRRGLVARLACGILPDRELYPCSLHWQADSYPLRYQGSPQSKLLSEMNTYNLVPSSLILNYYHPITHSALILAILLFKNDFELLILAVLYSFFFHLQLLRPLLYQQGYFCSFCYLILYLFFFFFLSLFY